MQVSDLLLLDKINDRPNTDIMEIEGGKLHLTSRVHEKNIIQNILDKKERLESLIEYSQREDNRIVDIYEVKRKKHITKFYPYAPLVIIGECDFYTEGAFEMARQRYKKYFSDLKFAERFFKDVVNEHVKLIENTKCYFTDVSGNNILVNEDFSDYVIIDVYSIHEFSLSKIKFKPLDILVSHKYKKQYDGVLSRFLEGSENIIDKIRKIESITKEF